MVSKSFLSAVTVAAIVTASQSATAQTSAPAAAPETPPPVTREQRKADTAAANKAGTLTPAGQGSDRVLANRRGVRAIGDSFERVQIMPCDDLGDLLAVVGEGRTQVRCDREVARLAVAPGQRLVGDLALQALAEVVVAALR